MRLKKIFLVLLLASIQLVIMLCPSWAIMASANVDRSRISLDERITLTIEILDDSNGRASQPKFQVPGFGMAFVGTSQQVVIQNGRVSVTRRYTYVLTPRITGVFTIPQIRIESGGESTVTQPIKVEVYKSSIGSGSAQGSAGRNQRRSSAYRQSAQSQDEDDSEEEEEESQPAATRNPSQPKNGITRQTGRSSDSVLIRATVDKTSAYPGEQVTLSVTFYTAVPLVDNPMYTPPVFRNFISEDLPPVRNGQTALEAGGMPYGYSEIKTALFAMTPGNAEIQEAFVKATIAKEQNIDPFDPNFIQNFFSGSVMAGNTKVLQSKPISVRIKPFPSGAPSYFNGTAGSYSMRSYVEKGKYKEGEPINFVVTISGTGNLKSITAPKMPDTPDFKVFDTQVSLSQNKNNDKLGGKKTFTYLLLPRSHGRKTIPQLKFSYFDPNSERYYTLQTKPVEIDVERGEGAGKNIYYNQTGGAEQVVTPTATDIRYVSDVQGNSLFAETASSIASMPEWIHLVPVIVFIALLAVKKFARYRDENPQLFRFKGAKGKAHRQIDEARSMIKAGQPSEAVSLLYDALMDYLSDKCGEKVSAMQSRKAMEVIRSRFPRVEEAELESIRSLWQELEMHHYAPGKADMLSADALAQRCRLILKMLDGKLK